MTPKQEKEFKEMLVVMADKLYKLTGDKWYKKIKKSVENDCQPEFPAPGDHYWAIYSGCDVAEEIYDDTNEFDEARKKIGNCFKTEQEAEKVVEKIMAFKYLKGHEFKFTDWDDENGIVIHADIPNDEWGNETVKNLNLLFMEDEK